MLPLEIKKMTLLEGHVALCQANKNFTNSKPMVCKCGFLTNRRNFKAKNRNTYRKVLDKNLLDLMVSRLRIRVVQSRPWNRPFAR